LADPRILVYCSLFPSAAAPAAGTFIRERAFRIGKRFPILVVSPQPWSPVDGLLRIARRTFRPPATEFEIMDGVAIFRPRYLSFPGALKSLDGWLMARGSMKIMRRLQREFRPDVIDAHFIFPDGYAASLLGRALGLPITITLRGSKDQKLLGTAREPLLRRAVDSAARLFAVSDSLKRDVGLKLGQAPDRIVLVGNGVDSEKFRPVDRVEARQRLGIAPNARVIIGVGGLVEGKGFQRVIPLIKRLRQSFPNLVYLIVGGGASQGDMRPSLEALARKEGVADAVRFCGRQLHDELLWYYGAADVFVLATAYEGWANVLLEAMACGLPVVTTRVGGNEEVVSSAALGELVEYWDAEAFAAAIERALLRDWDRETIIAYARSNSWDRRIDLLEREFRSLLAEASRRKTLAEREVAERVE
jgi:glycosyltransferase involved in cell wall biosynthesis